MRTARKAPAPPTTTVYLRPRGEASPLARWSDPRPTPRAVVRETAHAWDVAIPGVAEPVTFPKFAWEAVEQ